MNRKFVLIDQSIEDSTGHYLEYARRVLGAAKTEGFRTVLAVNHRAQNIECPEADLILRSFSKTYWENQAQSKLRTLTGFILKNLDMATRSDHAKKFAEEIDVLINEARVTESDIVFIPTLGGSELMGLSLYSASNAAASIHWHLLFRRDIAQPRGWFDLRRRMSKWYIKASFAVAKAAFSRGKRYFYTDTEELTSRYEGLGVGTFKTLPIPIDLNLGYKRPWESGPLIISYLGDLREEKGIHHIPKIIQSLRDDGFDASRVQFRIQGNFPNGIAMRSAARIKKTLASKKMAGVELLDGPLTSSAYSRVLLGTDIVLLPYSATNYGARSSGVYAEAVAAGIPTIHPQDSWMGRNASNADDKGYTSNDNIAEKLKKILLDYQYHEMASREFCKKWRAKHSAKNLVEQLTNNYQVDKHWLME